MEQIHQYRYVVDREVVKLFEEAAKKVLKRKGFSKLGFIGLIADYTRKEHHDIDLIIFPAKNARIGETMIELMKFYDSIEKQIKKKNERYYLATCPKMAMQEMVYYIASIEEGSAGMIPVHSLFFTDYKSMRRLSPKKFIPKIQQFLIPLKGSLKETKELVSPPQEKLEPYFFVLDFEMNARIKTFPRHNVRAAAEHLFQYLKFKYNIDVKDKTPHSLKEIETEIVKIMRRLDKKTYH